jgi:hypothetical protein
MRAGRGRFRGHRTYNDSSLTADNISGGDGAGSVQMDAKYVSTQRVRSELASTRSIEFGSNQVEIDKGWILPDNADGSKNNTFTCPVKYVEFTGTTPVW